MQIRIEKGIVEEKCINEEAQLRKALNSGISSLDILSNILHTEKIRLTQELEGENKDIEFDLYEVFETDEERELYLELPVLEESKTSETPGKLDKLIKQLNTCSREKQVDEMAEAFLAIMDKPTRKELVDFLLKPVLSTRHLLPFYARLVAVLGKLYKDIPHRAVVKLEQFLLLTNEAKESTLQVKMRQMKLLSELIKYQVAPSEMLLNCLDMCFSDFNGDNIEIASHILTSCGRYLYRHPLHNERTDILINRMLKLKYNKQCSPDIEYMIDEACLACKPREKLQKKKHPVMYEYVLFIVGGISMDNFPAFSRYFRELLPQAEGYVVKAVKKTIKRGKIEKFTLISRLLAESPACSALLLDLLIEEVLCDLAENDLRKYQFRVNTIRFISELHRSSVIDANLVFDLLYTLLYYEYDPTRETDCFRAKLVWVLLDPLRQSLTAHRFRRQINEFFVHLQDYYLSKAEASVESVNFLKELLDIFKPSRLLNKENAKENHLKLVHGHIAFIEDNEEAKEEDSVALSEERTESSGEEDSFARELETMKEESCIEGKSKDSAKDKNIHSLLGEPLGPNCFKILSKNASNKIKYKTVVVPEDHPITQSAQERKRVQERERESLSKQVLQFHERSTLEEDKKP